MLLADWMEKTSTTTADVARCCEVTWDAAKQWVDGRTVPRYHAMRDIYKMTGGLVTPLDFYDITTDPPR